MNWGLDIPEARVTAAPPAQSVADRLIRALQNGDVAVVLTRRRLDALIALCERSWNSETEFELWIELKNLRDTTA
jgi:hypothetical protein